MNDDPFAAANPPVPDHERTVVRPRPGARGAGAARHDLFAPTPHGASDAQPFVPIASHNKLLEAAYPLLAIVPALRTGTRPGDLADLRAQLSGAIRAFEHAAQSAGIGRDTIIAARYVLCTFADEAISSTPWGGGGAWAADPLLVRFHSEAWGGEKVFQLLSKLAEAPQQNRDLLELIYSVISLGYSGRYSAIDGGRAQLDSVRERLYSMLRDASESVDQSLSPRWQAASIERRRWFDATPVWVFCGVLGLLAVGGFLIYNYFLGQRSDPVFAAIQAIRPATPPPPPRIVVAASPRLAGFLKPEIDQGLVAVRDEAGKSVVTILGDGLFQSGAAVISSAAMPVIDRIGQALAQTPGKVLISGHTDNQPIRSVRFPSNWNLSQERASAVHRRLTQAVDAERLRAEGRADQEPVAGNDTAAGRALNRRVEITLYTQP